MFVLSLTGMNPLLETSKYHKAEHTTDTHWYMNSSGDGKRVEAAGRWVDGGWWVEAGAARTEQETRGRNKSRVTQGEARAKQRWGQKPLMPHKPSQETHAAVITIISPPQKIVSIERIRATSSHLELLPDGRQ